MRRAVRGEGHDFPRIPVKEIHQGTSSKSIISTDSFLSFSQILLQILKTGKWKKQDFITLSYENIPSINSTNQNQCSPYLKYWIDGRITDELLPLLPSLSGGQIPSRAMGTFFFFLTFSRIISRVFYMNNRGSMLEIVGKSVSPVENFVQVLRIK